MISTRKILTPLLILLIGILFMYRFTYEGGQFKRLCNETCATAMTSFRSIVVSFISIFATNMYSPTAVVLSKSIMGMCEKTCNLIGFILP